MPKRYPVTSAAAVAVTEVIETLTEKRPGIKWVNDVYLDGKKICGILTEAVTDMESGDVQNVIIGIGLNVSTDAFPAELREEGGVALPRRGQPQPVCRRDRVAAPALRKRT